MLGELLPATVHVVAMIEDPPGIELYAEEREAMARAVESRIREFATGRHCARLAMGRLGRSATAIGRGEAGSPIWPPGVVGSITHCAGYRAAAVANSSDLASVGIDAEPAAALPDHVLELVSLPEERSPLTELADRCPEISWDRLLFSAKESVYKACWPLLHRFLEFDQAEISIAPDPADSSRGTFDAHLLVPVGDSRLSGALRGRYVQAGGLVATAVVVGHRSGVESAARHTPPRSPEPPAT